MIPLAQFLSDQSDDEFMPLRAPAPRRPAAPQVRSFETGLPRVAVAVSPRPAATPRPAAPAMPAHQAPQAQRPVPAAAVMRPVSEQRVPLRELEAERRAWAREREALAGDLQAAVAEARQAGIAEAEASLRQDLERVSAAELDALRERLLADHGATVADARRRWVEEEGDRLADLVILQMAVFEDALKTTLTALLRPLVLDARKRMTVDELAGAVKTIAFDGTTVKIAASGPSDLLNALETKLGDHARHVSFDADETHTDVRIDANQTVIETRLAAWLKAVEEALS